MEELSIDQLNAHAVLLVDAVLDKWAPEEAWVSILEDAGLRNSAHIDQVCAFVRRCKNANLDLKVEVELDPPQELLSEGTKLDQITVGPLIKSGGMGSVYEGIFQGPDMEPRRVAVKVIQSGLETEKLVRRLRAERYLLSRLKHPNIVDIFSTGSTPTGYPYFSMELVEGASRIDRYCLQKDLPTAERMDLFRKLCAVVGFVHENNTVHRDLKPGNILMNQRDELKLLDFGLATPIQSVDDAPSFVNSELTPRQHGTPGRMSPQQAQGLPGTITDDIYALGTILRDMLAGRKNEDPSLESKAREIVSRCLLYEPSERFQTAADLSSSVEQIVEPIALTADILAPRPARTSVQKIRWAIAAILILISLSFIGIPKIVKWSENQATEVALREEAQQVASAVARIESPLAKNLEPLTGAKGSFAEQEARALEMIGKNDDRAKADLGAAYFACGNIAKRMELESQKSDPSPRTIADDLSDMVPLDPDIKKKMREKSELSVKRVVWKFVATLGADCSEAKVDKSLEWFQDLAKRYPKSDYPGLLAELFVAGGPMVPKNPNEAYKWAQIAAANGEADGIKVLGDLYFEGNVVLKNKEAALEYWKRAADLGIQRAQIALAEAQLEVNRPEAYMWAVIASSNHPPRPIDALIEIQGRDRSVRVRAIEVRQKIIKLTSENEARTGEAMAKSWSAKHSK